MSMQHLKQTKGAKISVIAKKLLLKNFTPKIDIENKFITVVDVNRPALQLYGFYEHFDEKRAQVIGIVEWAYLFTTLDEQEREKKYRQLLSHDIPCMVFCRDFQPESSLLEVAYERGIPIFGTFKGTSELMQELISTLTYELAPTISIHGVFVDVYGVGLLITGESGIGKSEAALELVRRGHRLVADDVVDIRRINQDRLIGKPPAVLQHFIELRGVGIIDVKSLFGVECIKLEQQIDFVIHLEEWKPGAEYDRMGLSESHTDILGVNLVCYNIPIRPGRNLAVICETAAANFRQKEMGYNAAQELTRRVQENMRNQ